MGNISDALSRVLADVQAVYQKIEAAMAKNHEAARSDLQQAGAVARELAASLRTVAESQRNDARQYLKSAAAQLEHVGERAAALAHATQSEVPDANECLLGRVSEIIENIGRAIESLRSNRTQND